MKSSFWMALGLSFLIAIAAALGVWLWRQQVISNRAEASKEIIAKQLEIQEFAAARSALQGIANPETRTTQEKQIRMAELQQGLQTRDTALMKRALEPDGGDWMDPKLIETAELELAREAVQRQDYEAYRTAAKKWASTSRMPGQWTLLEADCLLAQKLLPEATEFLKNAKLTGSEDALRHARLAILQANEPWKALATIDQGLKSDPTNAELLSFRAQIQEVGGRPAEARYDYVAAVISDRKNPVHRENLANFYLRRGDPSAAAETWRECVVDTGLGVYALKAWFWSRMCGMPLSQPLPQPRQRGGWFELSESLAHVSALEFWNPDAESRHLQIPALQGRPEILWLHVLEHTQKKEYLRAYEILDREFPKSAELLWPNLATYLRVHLAALCGQNPRIPLASHELSPLNEDAHSFLKTFHRWAKREDTDTERAAYDQWLTHPGSLVSTLIASGWGGAALILGQDVAYQLPPGAPDGLDYAYAKVIANQGDTAKALKWLSALPTRSHAATLLQGEMLLAANQIDEGLACLKSLTTSQSPLASRAQWTIALTELNRNQPAQCRAAVQANPELAASTQGKELLARAALAEGDRTTATAIYTALGESSADAMIFLSKEAFAAKQFDQARTWTLALARRFPEQPEFRKNLIKIDEAAAAAKQP